jgi:hypothetical protein
MYARRHISQYYKSVMENIDAIFNFFSIHPSEWKIRRVEDRRQEEIPACSGIKGSIYVYPQVSVV